MGTLLLEGGAEFSGRMREPDLKAIEKAGGLDAPVRILPTAAAPDNNHRRAGNNGVRWFQSLGARDVRSVPVIDKTSANDKQLARLLEQARLIYLLGGFTHYLGQTLKDSLAWQAIAAAYREGAVIAGSSAGAMVLCQFYYDPGAGQIQEGLNLLPGALVLPHHNTFGKNWAPGLQNRLPHETLVGIDEQTGTINDVPGRWSVYGQGAVTLYSGQRHAIIESGYTFSL